MGAIFHQRKRLYYQEVEVVEVRECPDLRYHRLNEKKHPFTPTTSGGGTEGVKYCYTMKYMRARFQKTITYVSAFVLLLFTTVPVRAQLQDWGETPGQPNYCVVDGVPTLKCLEVVYGNVLYISSALVLLVLFLMLVYGAFTFLTSMGETNKTQKGQKILTWAFIGIGVYAASYLILLIIDVAFMGGQGKVFNFNLPGP